MRNGLIIIWWMKQREREKLQFLMASAEKWNPKE